MKTTKLAVPVWNNRIAPVFDSAFDWLVIEIADNKWRISEELRFETGNYQMKLNSLLDHNFDGMICGALPCRVEGFFTESNCQVHSFICGAIEEVVDEYVLTGHLKERFSMPGCGRRRGRRWRNCQNNNKGGSYAQ